MQNCPIHLEPSTTSTGIDIAPSHDSPLPSTIRLLEASVTSVFEKLIDDFVISIIEDNVHINLDLSM